MADEQTVEITTRSWLEIVEAADPKFWTRRDPAYELSNGRKFEDPRQQ
jgi:hypothetical protein